MHTEGTIVFADHDLYENRYGAERYEWARVKRLLSKDAPDEAAGSSLLDIFKSFTDRFEKNSFAVILPGLVAWYMKGKEAYDAELERVLREVTGKHDLKYEEFEYQAGEKFGMISQVESFLLAHGEQSVDSARRLARDTLAYFLATPEQQKELEDMFGVLAENIERQALTAGKRTVYGKTLLTLAVNQEIEGWVSENIETLRRCGDEDSLFGCIWPIIRGNIQNSVFLRIAAPEEMLFALAKGWMEGRSFVELFQPLQAANIKMGVKKGAWRITIYNVVEVCESAFSFEGMLIVGALKEAVDAVDGPGQMLESLQQRIKYGLKNRFAVWLYERGLKDRCLVRELATLKPIGSVQSLNQLREVFREDEECAALLGKYPSYFENTVNG